MSNGQSRKHRALQLLAFAAVACVALLFWERGAPWARSGIEPSPSPPPGVWSPHLMRQDTGRMERVPPGEVESHDSGDERLTTLVVVDAESGDRVAGAEVFVSTNEELYGGPVSVRALPDREALMLEVGQRLISDERGEVTVGSYGRGLHVCARHAERFGLAGWYELEASGRQLKIFSDRALVIRVVDARGLPRSDVLVALDELTGSRLSRDWSAWTSEPSGEARLLHSIDWSDERRSMGRLVGQIYATFGFPLEDGPRVEVDPAHPPMQPISLVLPPTGELLVRLEREDGTAVPDGTLVPVHRAEQESTPSGVFGARWLRQEVLSRDGVALFPFVGLGLELEVESAGPEDCERIARRIAGPTQAGEQVLLSLRHETTKRVLLSGRVLRSDGSPVANAEMTYVTRAAARNLRLDGTSEYDWGDLKTDGDGNFELVHPPSEMEDLTLYMREYNDCRVQLESGTSLPSPLRPGHYDLGDFLLKPAPLLVSGRALDVKGQPIHTTVFLKRKEHEDLSGEDWFWDAFGPFRDCTDEHGRFELRGAIERGEFALFVGMRGFHEQTIPISVGATGIRIELREETIQGLTGSVVLDEGIPGGLLSIELERQDSDDSPPSVGFADREHFGARLEPGRYRVDLLLEGQVPMVEPLSVLIHPGVLQEPLALQDIDLRGRLHPLRVRVEDEDGCALDSWVSVAPSTGSKWVYGKPVGDGVLQLITPWPVNNIFVSAPGHFSVLVEGATEECRVILPAGIPLCLTLSQPVDLPEDCSVELQLIRSSLNPRDRPLNAARIGEWIEGVVPLAVEGTEFELFLPTPGQWKLSWLLEWKSEQGQKFSVLDPAGGELTIADRLVVQHYVIEPPDRHALDLAVDAMRD